MTGETTEAPVKHAHKSKVLFGKVKAYQSAPVGLKDINKSKCTTVFFSVLGKQLPNLLQFITLMSVPNLE